MNGRLGVALAIAWLGAILVFALLAPLLSTHDPLQPVAAPLTGPSLSMPLGSDALGRDVWSRLAYGARLTLAAATLSTTLTVVIGSVLGLAAAASGGWTDRTIVAAANAALAIPGLVLAMLIVAAIGPSLTAVVLAVGLGAVPGFARLARTTFLQVREKAYVTASGALGAGQVVEGTASPSPQRLAFPGFADDHALRLGAARDHHAHLPRAGRRSLLAGMGSDAQQRAAASDRRAAPGAATRSGDRPHRHRRASPWRPQRRWWIVGLTDCATPASLPASRKVISSDDLHPHCAGAGL